MPCKQNTPISNFLVMKFIHQDLCYFHLEAEMESTIHVSPNGMDVENCGSERKKCRTIDYALIQSKSNNVMLILENSPNKTIVHNTKGMLRLNNNYLQLRITKECKDGANPTIYGYGSPFIAPTDAIYLSIDAVDLQNIAIINSTNQNSSIALSLQSMSIKTKLMIPFISMNQMKNNVNVTMQSCILKSSNNNPWLNISMANVNIFRSNIKLINDIIEGGSFFLENVEEFELSKSKIQNIHDIAVYKPPKVPSYITLVNVREAVFRSNTTVNNSTFISFIYARNSFIDIENLYFHVTVNDYTFLVWRSSFKANQIQVVHCKLKHRLFSSEESKNITIQRFELQNTTIDKNAFVVLKSNFNAKEIQVFDCFVNTFLFYGKESDNITIERFESQNTTIDKDAFVVLKSNFNAKEIQVFDCFVKTILFYSSESDNITIQRFELQNTKIDDSAFFVSKSNFNTKEIRVINCFVKGFIVDVYKKGVINIKNAKIVDTELN